MTDAKRDNNRIPVALGVLSSDGSTPTMLEADPSTHILDIHDASTGSDNGGSDASRDDNRVTTLMAVSESDGTTPVALYVDANGNLLVDSN